ncbi:MAG: hypothetical protein LBT40_02380 [Deltaproteobacteria bacterium]|jgi:hypothetical protein|nr:hypothetical protein [Deltaproteobacteria bacterium]
MKPEAKVKARAKALFEAAGAYWTPIVQSAITKAGHPDADVCFRGRFLGVECKSGKKKPTPLQRRRLREIAEAGGVSMVVNEDRLKDLERYLADGGDTDPAVLDRLLYKEAADDD